MRVKFLDFKNGNQLDKKLKSYKKDLNEQFKNKINLLKDLTLDQEKFNSLISQLISDMSLDENIDNEEKKDEENNNKNKERNSQDQPEKNMEKD